MLTVAIEALPAKVGALSLEAQEKLEKDTAKKEAQAEAKAEAAQKNKMVRVGMRLPGVTRLVRQGTFLTWEWIRHRKSQSNEYKDAQLPFLIEYPSYCINDSFGIFRP